MMGRQTGDQSRLFYSFNLDERIADRHLLRRINPVVTRVLAELRSKLKPYYSGIGRPSIDPELMLRMLIVGYCYGSPLIADFFNSIDPTQTSAGYFVVRPKLVHAPTSLAGPLPVLIHYAKWHATTAR